MRILLFVLMITSPTLMNAQKRDRIPTDSVKYYQQKLNKLWRTTYDSLRSSEKYNDIVNNLKRLQNNAGNYTGPVVYCDIVHSDYTKINSS